MRLFANKDWKESSCFNMGRSFHSLFRLLPATSQRKISQHHWKEGVIISKVANEESALLKTNADVAPQGRGILQL